MKRTALALVGVATMVGGLSGCTDEEVARAAIQRYFPARQQENAMDVAECESGYDPDAVSPDGRNHGLFQINNVHRQLVRSMGYRWRQIYDPNVNTHVARRLWNESGWRPWGGCAP